MKRISLKRLTVGLAVAVMLAPGPAGLRAEDGETAAYHPVITISEGSVMVMGVEYSIWEPAPEGTLLLSGDKVKTGWNSRAEIRFMSGVVRLYENSLLIVPSIGVQDRRKDVQDIVVEEGEVLFNINPLGAKKQFEFRTKNVQGGVKGTVFKVGYNNEKTTVGVYDGKVWVSGSKRGKDKVRVLKAGQAVRLDTVNDLVNVENVDLDDPDKYMEDVIKDRDKDKDKEDKDKDDKDKDDEDDKDKDDEDEDNRDRD